VSASGQPPSNGTVEPTHEDENKGPTLVTLDLEYAFANPIHAAVSSAFFGQVSKMMVEAFEKRCLALHGPGTQR
jgi:coenzyme Q-binding protein COQ10